MSDSHELWTLDELTDRVEQTLAEGYAGAPSGRVRDVPDRRTIRYYTTLGLIDRPAEMRGRTALYGRRHLLQIVAIKKLQAAGRPLAEVQQALAGRTDAELTRIAGQGASEESPGTRRSAARSERAFWRRPAADASTFDLAGEDRPDSAPAPVDEPAIAAPTAGPGWLQGLPLGMGVSLLLSPARPIDGDDALAIRSAAEPLLRLLMRSRLIEPVPDQEGEHR